MVDNEFKQLPRSVVAKLKKTYESHGLILEDDTIDPKSLKGKAKEDLRKDLSFYLTNQNDTPISLLCAKLDNYFARSPSQVEILKYANFIANNKDLDIPKAVHIWGPPGVGKMHIAVGIAKDYIKRHQSLGAKILGYTSSYKKLGDNLFRPDQLWIMPRVCEGFSIYHFMDIIDNVYNQGGILITTSHFPLKNFLADVNKACDEKSKQYYDYDEGDYSYLHQNYCNGDRDEMNRICKNIYSEFRVTGFDDRAIINWKDLMDSDPLTDLDKKDSIQLRKDIQFFPYAFCTFFLNSENFPCLIAFFACLIRFAR